MKFNGDPGSPSHHDLRPWLVLAILAAATGFFWIVPMFQPRGVYFWGHYRFPDVYLGIPIALATFCLTVVLVTPVPRRRQRALQMTTLFLATVIALYGADLVYLVGFNHLLQKEPSDYWLDSMATSRKENLPDAELGYVRKAGLEWRQVYQPGSRVFYYRTDEKGFRNPPGITHADIAFVGDSFTEGATVPDEDTFVRRVQAMTGRTTVNLGRGGYGAEQEAIIMRRDALDYHPKVIVWMLDEHTDLWDADIFTAWKKNPTGLQPFLDRYARRSLFTRLIPLKDNPRIDWQRKLRLPDGTLVPVCINAAYEPDAPARHPVGWAATKQAVVTAQQLCQERGIQLLIIFLPIQVRVLSDYIVFHGEKDRNHWLPGGRADDERDFGSALGKFCRQIHCPFIDLAPALRREAASNPKTVFFTTTDVHLDMDGHKAVASAIADWLRSQ